MAFDAGHRNPTPPRQDADPPAWVDFLVRLAAMSMFGVLYVAWVLKLLGDAFQQAFLN